jgi:hypothetical protein
VSVALPSRVAAVFAAVASFSSWTISSATAGSHSVTTTIDVIDAEDGVLSLREAVIAANAGNGAQNILVPAGTYTLTLTGEDEDASLTGDLDLTGHVHIMGAGDGDTILDGNASDRLLDVLSGANVSVSDLTIQNGRTGDNFLIDSFAGGIRASDCACVTPPKAVSAARRAWSGGMPRRMFSAICISR